MTSLISQRLKLSLVTGTVCAMILTSSCPPVSDRSLFFSRLFFASAIDTEYVPEDDDSEDVVVGCWLFDLFSRLFG